MTLSLPRRGVTLMQLLIVLIVLAMLFALLLPAVFQVRRAAARAQSQNNIKQIAIAVHSFHDAMGRMPHGVTKEGFSAHAMILPYIEQENLYRRLNFNTTPTTGDNATVRKSHIKTYLSPLDEAMPTTETGPTNYFFSAGSSPTIKGNNGVFVTWHSPLQLTNIRDGTSNTIMVGETLRGDGSKRAVTVARQHVALKEDALKEIKPEAGVDDWKNDKNIAGDRGAAWMDGKFLQTLFTATRAMNDDKPDVDCGGAGGLSGLRTAINGTNVGLCDGSVRFVNVGVKLETWKALATSSGREVIPNDF